jgi:hypothetical protein
VGGIKKANEEGLIRTDSEVIRTWEGSEQGYSTLGWLRQRRRLWRIRKISSYGASCGLQRHISYGGDIGTSCVLQCNDITLASFRKEGKISGCLYSAL